MHAELFAEKDFLIFRASYERNIETGDILCLN